MFCENCGFKLIDGSKFCPQCGQSVPIDDTSPWESPTQPMQQVPQTQPMQQVPQMQQMPNNQYGDNYEYSQTQRCPKCGSARVRLINESNIVGSNYKAGNGCLGFLLMGPLGLLCGLCGANQKTVNKLSWVCDNCGEKFDRQQDIEAAKKAESSNEALAAGSLLFCGIVGIILAPICFLVSNAMDIELFTVFGVILAVVGIPELICGIVWTIKWKKKHGKESDSSGSADADKK